jgi:hypothetical protein
MISIKDLMIQEVQKGLDKAGVRSQIEFLGNELVITIKPEEIRSILTQGFPDAYKSAVQIECGEIKIKVKVI